MKNIKHKLVLILLVLFPLLIAGCWYEDKIYIKKNKIIIQGENYIENEDSLVIEPGTTVEFRYSGRLWFIYFEFAHYPTLTVRNGGVIIAQGTAENPIYINSYDYDQGEIYITDSNSQENYFKYCDFSNIWLLSMGNSKVIIENCKFNNGDGRIGLGGREDYQNEFAYNYVICGTYGGVGVGHNTYVAYNNFVDGNVCFANVDNLGSNYYPDIRYNNITGSPRAAVILTPQVIPPQENTVLDHLVIHYNYIANCNGKTGVDTDGSQCGEYVTHSDPRTEPVESAGPGW